MQWQGKCGACGEWNSLSRMQVAKASPGPPQLGFNAAQARQATKLSAVPAQPNQRLRTGFGELDRVLGGGLVPGAVVLIGGDPGAGKSTLLLQVCAAIDARACALYVSGEESLQQLTLRAKRLGLELDSLTAAALTRAETIAELIADCKPQLVVLDSVQVLQLDGVDGAPGSVAQVRETAAYFVRLAKSTGIVVVLVGHVTKEGNLAGPKVLEHMIDASLMLDSPAGSRYRTLRSQKNRFGPVNELGVFAMTGQGLREVANPSAIFLQRGEVEAPGSVATVVWEGTRPLLVELQALVNEAQGGYPRRIAVGLDQQRLAMHLAVLQRHCGIVLTDQDVFANVVGGVRIAGTSGDLALLLAVLSSLRGRPLPRELIVFGELGLTGEVRPVPNGQERLREARKHGFKTAIIPYANRPQGIIKGMAVHGVKSLGAALDVAAELP